MTSTQDLIESLVAEAKPVRRLLPPTLRAACWLAFAALILTLVALEHGVRPDLMNKRRFHKDWSARRRVFQQIRQQPSLRNAP
ncbi:NrsF family protein [Burkholderia cepacia]|uniref:NrsF family protein n=1 Tax=Burkholderia cepacia TaxID=292 RepID=UPI001B90D4ED|nr:DUF1109 family protein [Burkholderia cenocepacia]MBU9660236.1 DUF1109 domain-containing protein [Burkholderia cenocepacia]